MDRPKKSADELKTMLRRSVHADEAATTACARLKDIRIHKHDRDPSDGRNWTVTGFLTALDDPEHLPVGCKDFIKKKALELARHYDLA
jgi:hypothetical protein